MCGCGDVFACECMIVRMCVYACEDVCVLVSV